MPISGTEGYAEEAEDLFKRYESIPFADAHRAVLHLIPAVPGRVLDIGAGTGRDAAWFAGRGHRSSPSSQPMRCACLPWRCIHRPGSNGSTTACRISQRCRPAARPSTS